MNKLFCVKASKYDSNCNFEVYYPASLDNPRDHSVMFINKKNICRISQLLMVNECIVFFPKEEKLSDTFKQKHLMIASDDPRTSYCLFFRENNITNLPKNESVENRNGALIAKSSIIGEKTTIMPFAYVGGEVTIGEGCYIGVGARIVGRAIIGDNVIIRENTVIGADGLSTDRDSEGKAATMPQFGGVVIEDNVQIGACCIIARGAIDNTIIRSGCKIDNSTFISHNVTVGEDTFIVGETIMFGGSSTGKTVFISGNSTIRNKVSIGNGAIIGMGSVVTKDVKDHVTVMGNPAHQR